MILLKDTRSFTADQARNKIPCREEECAPDKIHYWINTVQLK